MHNYCTTAPSHQTRQAKQAGGASFVGGELYKKVQELLKARVKDLLKVNTGIINNDYDNNPHGMCVCVFLFLVRAGSNGRVAIDILSQRMGAIHHGDEDRQQLDELLGK